MSQPINIQEKLDQFQEQWSPRVIAALNGQHVKLAKLEGAFVWHSHEREDELFYVVKGELEMRFRDRTEVIKAGEMIVVPKGIEHQPVAHKEVHVMLFEPDSTVNTGTAGGERTVDPVWI